MTWTRQLLKIVPLAAALCLTSAAAFAQLSDDEDRPLTRIRATAQSKSGHWVSCRTHWNAGASNLPQLTSVRRWPRRPAGVRSGASIQGRLNLATDLDFEKAVGAKGLSFHGNVFAIHGDQFTNRYLQSFMAASGIEGLATVRLFEAWFEQKLANDRLSLRLGQLSADTEFITTKFSEVFTNATFTWPAAAAINRQAAVRQRRLQRLALDFGLS